MKRTIPFEKYEATGNDFIILDFFEFEWIDLNDTNLIKKMCDRHFGIGADGLIALCPEPGMDFKMNYFNSDGKPSSFCGNGSRASVRYMQSKQGKNNFSFAAFDGMHESYVKDQLVSVKMKDINGFEATPEGSLIQSGSPHLIREVINPWEFEVNEKGRALRKKFDPEGVNVNFIEIMREVLRIATYERGVEAETLACGTGITASAYYAAVKADSNSFFKQAIESKGGPLEVQMDIEGLHATNIWLTGPANQVFSGFYRLH